MRVCILNHKSRDISGLSERIRGWGYKCSVFTDHTDFSRTRDRKRYWGINSNMLHILGSYVDEDWKIVIHDDLGLTKESLDAAVNVLKVAPSTLVSFYNPTNKLYKDVASSGHHVMQTYSSVWLPFFGIHNSLQKVLHQEMTSNFERLYEHGYAEDGLILRIISEKAIPIYSVFPSFCQHDGYDRSIHGNPAKCGKNLRNSFSYDSSYDYESIDWKHHFSNPYINRSKISWNK